MTTYNYANNNPIAYNYPLGDKPFPKKTRSIEEGLGGSGGGGASGRIGPGSGNYWSDGIGYSDWSSFHGSQMYGDGLAAGLTDLGGTLYRIEADGKRPHLLVHNGVAGYWTGNNYSIWDGRSKRDPSIVFNSTFHKVASQGGLVDMSARFDKQLQQTESFFSARNSELESMHVFPGTKSITRLLYFTKMVKTNAPYDLKNHGYTAEQIGNTSLYHGQVFRFDDYGNYNYGVAAKAYGLSLEMALIGAGLNQVWNGRGDSSNWLFYGDDPRDTRMIIEGYFRNDK